jgi:hypothetical protein
VLFDRSGLRRRRLGRGQADDLDGGHRVSEPFEGQVSDRMHLGKLFDGQPDALAGQDLAVLRLAAEAGG